MGTMAESSFAARKPQLMKEFRQTVAKIRPVFIAWYGAEKTDRMIEDACREYEALIPQLPEVGPNKTQRQFAVSSGWFLAMYRALVLQGGTLEEAGRLIFDTSAAYLAAVPGFLQRFFSYMSFSQRYKKGLEKRARESRERRYPQGYVFDFVPGDGKTFDYGVDYIECATVKFFSAQGVPELARYVCAVDKIYSEKLGWGLRRTMTLAEGEVRCDFRFTKGGRTDVAPPRPILQEKNANR